MREQFDASGRDQRSQEQRGVKPCKGRPVAEAADQETQRARRGEVRSVPPRERQSGGNYGNGYRGRGEKESDTKFSPFRGKGS